MLGPSHLLFAANAWAAYSIWTGQPFEHLALGAVVATAVSDGVLSPDMDQREPFEWARTILGPASRLLTHRIGLTHWWVLPVIAWVWWLPLLDPSSHWAATALLIGWFSHILGDAIFGRIPLLPGWGPRYGLGLHTGGWVESGGKWTLNRSPLRVALVASLGWLLWLGVQSAA